ncbi:MULTISPECIES: phosphotransferase enzyme family protein [Methylomonas]|uniref:Aminoglycoside phosphotransferase n=2 Tax=Methylomonas TaxID=416 RepID=A0A126T530_9GAMM|nr:MULTISPECIES: aminoglycoside phosphotransferase family protein [Methylomonas]AMK77172.1 aminoglycoside phosphotransferase [Methylomonas denitrificans]OAI00999.1 aminoglycoside phosphotransferase [Methylomonas methanica]TCV78935.1 Ser/Thr protein kinase RdoA (MazF antagonist) [Methylomonas methanica]
MNKLQGIAGHFAGGQYVGNIRPLGNGLINDTFLVNAGDTQFVLQGINSRVFPQPEQVVTNLQQLNRHIAQQDPANVRLLIPSLLPANDGEAFYRDGDGQIWRALELISPAESREQLGNQAEASQVGFALAHFHRLCGTLAPELLHDTLPGFHIAPAYYQSYLDILDRPLPVTLDDEFRQCQQFIEGFRERIAMLEQAKQRGELQERVIHGDPKLNNFLFEPGSDRIISLIDLDTVKPGLVHYDIGDCLRSCCHIRPGNQFDVPRCKTILASYLAEAGQFFEPADYDYLYAAIQLIPFELGLRFFSDYLQGNRYFKVNQPRENLQRAMDQFALCENIARQETELRHVIASIV